jgi:hypothetical protein
MPSPEKTQRVFVGTYRGDGGSGADETSIPSVSAPSMVQRLEEFAAGQDRCQFCGGFVAPRYVNPACCVERARYERGAL